MGRFIATRWWKEGVAGHKTDRVMTVTKYACHANCHTPVDGCYISVTHIILAFVFLLTFTPSTYTVLCLPGLLAESLALTF